MSMVVVARLVLETISPMAITSGFRETGFDTELARDANGLPYVPATSFVGVWRSVLRSLGENENFFGSTEQKSCLVVSHGVVHNSKNEPVIGLQEPETLGKDKLLARLLVASPIIRDRVALNDRAVATDQAKFDQLLLPTGVRFSFIIKLDSRYVPDSASDRVEQQLMQMLSRLNDRRFALGSTTRNGLGRIRVQACEIKMFDFMKGPEQAKQMHGFLRSQRVPQGSVLQTVLAQSLKVQHEIKLQGLGAWRSGSGAFLFNNENKKHEPHIKTYSEPYITWSASGAAQLQPPRPILCGSSIKGMLAHRVAFHWRRLNSQWAEALADESNKVWEQRPEALTELFGSEPGESDQSQLRAGKLWVEDSVIDYKHTEVRFHNAIDRFTGGVRKGALYSEEVLYQPRFTLRIWLAELPASEHKEKLLQALNATVEDIKNGLLPIGAGSGRGASLVREVS